MIIRSKYSYSNNIDVNQSVAIVYWHSASKFISLKFLLTNYWRSNWHESLLFHLFRFLSSHFHANKNISSKQYHFLRSIDDALSVHIIHLLRSTFLILWMASNRSLTYSAIEERKLVFEKNGTPLKKFDENDRSMQNINHHESYLNYIFFSFRSFEFISTISDVFFAYRTSQ